MLIEVKNLSLSYEKEILNNLSFKIDSDFVSIIGANGSGKTTLLKILSQNITNYSGQVFINDKNLRAYSKKELSQFRAYVSAEENITNDFNIVQYISLGRSPFQKLFGNLSKKDYEIINKTLDLLEIKELAEKNLSNISSGEKQRVQIARALVQESKLILLDEPISHLDINYQISTLKLLKKLSLEGIMIIIIIHDINLAAIFSEQIIILKNGSLLSCNNVENSLNKENLKKSFDIDWDIEYNPIRVFPKI
ncbi:MAG: ABC transporter ATP-binding protein [Candidatus Sericytochromatia bacterium]